MNKSLSYRLFWVGVFSIAFAFVESTVVVYLRLIYYPEGFQFPLKLMPSAILYIEVFREFSTMVMLAAIGYITGRNLIEKFFYFILSFGIWDIFYYIWLKVFLNWPSSLLEDDILFLIPVPWVGPVISPVIVSLIFIAASVRSLYLLEKGYSANIRKSEPLVIFSGLIVILISFIRAAFTTNLLVESSPGFPWIIFFAGVFLLLAGFILLIRNYKPPESF